MNARYNLMTEYRADRCQLTDTFFHRLAKKCLADAVTHYAQKIDSVAAMVGYSSQTHCDCFLLCYIKHH